MASVSSNPAADQGRSAALSARTDDCLGVPEGRTSLARSKPRARARPSTCSSCKSSTSTLAMTGLRHLTKTAVKASAYCKARMRLPLVVLQALLVESPRRPCVRGCSSTEGSVVRAEDLSGRWLQHDRAGYARIHRRPSASPRDARRGAGFPCPRSWDCSTPSAVWSCRCWVSRCTRTSNPRSGCCTRCWGTPAIYRREPRGRPAGGGSRVLLVRASGHAVFPRNSWAFPHSSEADRGLPAASQTPAEVPQGPEGPR